MKPILLLGATGFTGALCAQSLERMGQPFILAGRNKSKLENLLNGFTHAQGMRVVDVHDTEALIQAMDGVSTVLSTVGPFRHHGLAVVDAALEAGVHYVDTTAEQPFQHNVYAQYHQQALDKGITLLTGHACDFTFAYLGAALVDEAVGPMTHYHSYHGLDPFKPSPGTAVSALGMVDAPYLSYQDGEFSKQPRRLRAQEVDLPDLGTRYRAVPFPGGDVVLLPRDYPSLVHCESDLLLPPKEARGFAVFDYLRPAMSAMTPGFVFKKAASYIQNNLPHPTPEERAEGLWHVVVEGIGPRGKTSALIQGNDVYGISGDCAALGAAWLTQEKARAAGVVTTGRAFDAQKFLEALKPRGVRWSLHPA